MDWLKVDADLATNAKVDALSDGAFRAVVYLWAHATRQKTSGLVPASVARLVPRITPARLRELEAKGFLEPIESGGWRIHDFDEHQADALRFEERRARDRERKRRERRGGSDA